ncbi:hypothetical protein JCM3775_007154 [Rhodotorula graminis]|uniref:EXS domain-containing protein n=1 Tax=Rhodotorula graminis (strain WP1) TaxID=578459 RepID=A0A194SDJ8_RHOGW|nr:uncharacterized protein RHOBADRAFT_51138 [Rhodotorula graminis WP1]KPV78704.1 hypothetical protein RHOBADRAFT_51138 [Rhodotorula graminis WP1]
MDIDAPVHPGLSDFGLRYPLPLRIVVLSAVTALGFATNLHLLSHLGIDTAHVLDVRLEPANASSRAGLPPGAPPPYVHPTKLYPPLYSLAAATLAWAALGSLLHGALTGADPHLVVQYRLVPCLVALAVVVALCWPGNALSRPYRLRFLRALRRIVHPSLNAAVPFCDIILADILTSSAKVLGDVWLAGCLVLTGEGVAGVAGDACKRVWGVPFMTSLPYLFRFRQCLSEVYTRSTPTPRRSLLNALKYATAFPVIILSAMQTIIGDPFDADDDHLHEAGERWIGRTTLFNLWFLAVLVNSLYSFWWDVTNDWGLSLLSRSGWHSSPAVSYAFINPPPSSAYSHRGGIPSHLATGVGHSPSASQSNGHGRARSLAAGALLDPTAAAPGPHEHALNGAPPQHVLASTTFPPAPSRPHTPTPPSPKPASHSPSHLLHSHRPGHTRAFSTAATPNLSYPFLRPILLLPNPLVYYTAICVDLLLRLTWSLKLSSHLHSAQEVESGLFAVEALEVVRRWMWVFLRIEWEAVRKGAGNDAAPLSSSSATSPLGAAAGPSTSAAGVSWLDKGDSEARLRAHDEYELALRDAKGGGSGGERGGQGKGKGRALDPALEEEALGLLSSGSGGGRVREGELI